MKKMAFIDMEGVLVPEIWKYISKYFNIPELSVTTREVANYQELMNYRIDILEKNNIKLEQITDIIHNLKPIEGAKEFLEDLHLNKKFEIKIISDCFYEFLNPFFPKIGISSQNAYCHNLEMNENGLIEKVKYSRKKGKHEIIVKYQKENNSMKDSIAIGDAFNDFTMLHLVDHGFLFQPSEEVKRNAPVYFHTMQSYQEVIHYLDELRT